MGKDHLAKAFEAEFGLLQRPNEPHIGAKHLFNRVDNDGIKRVAMQLTHEHVDLLGTEADELRWWLHALAFALTPGFG